MRSLSAPALLLLTLPFAGCGKIGSLEDLGLDRFMPQVEFKRLKVDQASFTGLDTTFVFSVSNPNPIKVKLASFNYDLDLAGHDLLQGNQRDGLTLEAQGDSKIAFPVSITFAEIVKLVGDVSGKDELPFAFKGSIGFDTPLGAIKIPFQEKGKFPVLHAPKVRFQGVRVGKLDLLKQSATINVDLGFTHQGGGALSLAGFDYDLTLGGRKVLEGLIEDAGSVAAGQEKTVSLPVTLNLLQVGATIVDAITKKTKMEVGLDAKLSVGTPLGPIPLQINEKGLVSVK